VSSQVSHIRLEETAPYRALKQFAAGPGAATDEGRTAAPSAPRTLLGLTVRTPVLCAPGCTGQHACTRRSDAA
jgi:hypothetical protein